MNFERIYNDDNVSIFQNTKLNQTLLYYHNQDSLIIGYLVMAEGVHYVYKYTELGQEILKMVLLNQMTDLQKSVDKILGKS
jgi:hypothetical protein